MVLRFGNSAHGIGSALFSSKDTRGAKVASAETAQNASGSQGISRLTGHCSFSFDGRKFIEASQDATADVVGPLAHEPGWDFYEILTPSRGEVLHVRRDIPIRLIRLFACWPSSEQPLATAMHPYGVQATEVVLPAIAHNQLLVAICPPAAGSRTALQGCRSSGILQGRLTETSSPDDIQAGTTSEVFANADSPLSSLLGRCRSERTSHELPTGSSLWESCSSSSSAIALNSPMQSSCGSTSCTPRQQMSLAFDTIDSPSSNLEARKEISRASPDNGVTTRSLQQQVATLRKELEEEKGARQRADVREAVSQVEISRLAEECESLQRRLRYAERATMDSEMRARQLQSRLDAAEKEANHSGQRRRFGFKPQTIADVVTALASFEIEQLQRCSLEDRSTTKKKLLLRWHPDKNVSCGAGCLDLANRVMQELHSHPEWNR